MSVQMEIKKFLRELGVTKEWKIEQCKEVAMNRFNVKKSKRAYIKKILDDAFLQRAEIEKYNEI